MTCYSKISEERLVVTIDRAQRVYLGNEPVNIRELGKKILEQSPDAKARAVYVRSDATVPFGSFATVMDALYQAGIQGVSVVTEPIGARGAAK